MPLVDREIYEVALDEARAGMREGGIPIGSALARGGKLIAPGHNRRVQNGDPTAHAEIDCLRNAGRLNDYDALTLYTTLAPCFLCTGAVLLFGIPRVVIGECETYDASDTLNLLSARQVQVEILNDPAARALMNQFIREQPGLWAEDIGHRL